MTIEKMANTCFGPPPLPPNKRPASAVAVAVPQRKNSFSMGSNLTSSTYMSFKDPLDEILILSSEDLPPVDDGNTQCSQHRKIKNSSKSKHPFSLNNACESWQARDGSSESRGGAFLNSFQRSFSTRSARGVRCRSNSTTGADLFEYGIPLKTFSQTFGKKCDDLTNFGECNKPAFATIKNTPFSRPLSRQASPCRGREVGGDECESPPRFAFARSSSEGNLSFQQEKETPLSLCPLSRAAPPPGRLDKCLRVLSGSWKNLFLLGGMSRASKPAAQAKRVAPPAVPDAFGVPPPHRHSGSSFGSSQGYASSEDGAFMQPPDTPTHTRDDHSDYGSVVSGASTMSSGKSPAAGAVSAFAFPPPSQPLTHKAAVYYHHQLALQEDQGIDMTQSPGRDSPGSSSGSAGSCSRHSSASLDSGRASGRLPSGALGPAERVRRMLQQGLAEHEVIHAWLAELRLEEYAPLLSLAGYDVATMTRMTPEDLTAVGVKKPNHRKRLKAELANLNVPDNLPDYIPGSLEEWLRLLRLEEYTSALMSQGYRSVQDVTQLAWEDLEDTGIVRLGHQKKIVLAIKRVKDIRAGKRSISGPGPGPLDLARHMPHPSHSHPHHQESYQGQGELPLPAMHLGHATYQTHAHQPWELQQSMNVSASYHVATQHRVHPNELVPIQVRHQRGKSLESLEDSSERSHLTFSPEAQTFYYTNAGHVSPWRRSYDDGDITPTNEATLGLDSCGGGGTLPRPRGLVRPRPVAKVCATTKPVRENVIFHDVNEASPKYALEAFQSAAYVDKMGYQMRPVYAVSPHASKKMPPEPPKRQSSNPGIDQMTGQMEQMYVGRYSPLDYQYQGYVTTAEIHPEKGGGLPLSLPAYPSSDSLSVSLDSAGLLPPPAPAPASPCGARARPERPASRNGSDASFKSSSSTESDSLPFANENAGTIKQNRNQMGGRPHTTDYGRGVTLATLPPRHPAAPASAPDQAGQPADVLNDIGNMLANLTDELDAMLEEEKRQGLTDA